MSFAITNFMCCPAYVTVSSNSSPAAALVFGGELRRSAEVAVVVCRLRRQEVDVVSVVVPKHQLRTDHHRVRVRGRRRVAVRADARHNFSPYFYPIYLSPAGSGLRRALALGAPRPAMLGDDLSPQALRCCFQRMLAPTRSPEHLSLIHI